MAKGDTVKLFLKLESLKPDATPYKAYSPTFLGNTGTGDVYVSLDVSKENVSQMGVHTVITLPGLVEIGAQVIDKIHAHHSRWNV